MRVEKHFLGSFTIPFNTLYNRGRVEGLFRLDTPALNFGYDHKRSQRTRRNDFEGAMFKGEVREQENRLT